MPRPDIIEIIRFFDNYERHLSDDDVGILYHEEFCDRYTDEESDSQLLDADMSRAVEWNKTGSWPDDNWQWWK